MTERYTQDDADDAIPNHMPLVATDVEINANISGDDIVVRVNKAGILICRVLLQDAAKDMSAAALSQFSTFAPDFPFKVGDSQDGIKRLARSLGIETSPML